MIRFLLCVSILSLSACAVAPRDGLFVEPGDLVSALNPGEPLSLRFTLVDPTEGTLDTLLSDLRVMRVHDSKALEHSVKTEMDGSDVLIEVSLDQAEDAWVFVGFRALPNKVEHALTKVETKGYGVRVRSTHGPTPRFLQVCSTELGATGVVEFSEPVILNESSAEDGAPVPLELVVDGSTCRLPSSQGAAITRALFACSTSSVSLVRLVIRGGIRSAEGEVAGSLVSGSPTLVGSYSTDDARMVGSCAQWAVQ